jgi:molybdopterin-guanine dinucleotide biosynthesis protein B
MVASARRWALMRDLRGEPEATLADLMGRMSPVDLLLVEGFKRENYEKLEVHRTALARPLLCHDDPRIVAVASDSPLPELDLPQLELDDIEAIAAFIVERCALKG